MRVALTHYAPVTGTLAGEPERLFTVLGSQAIGAAIDASGTHLAVHGHAHHCQEHGSTPGGVPVRNVAYPIIRQAIPSVRRSAHGRWRRSGDDRALRPDRWVGAVGPPPLVRPRRTHYSQATAATDNGKHSPDRSVLHG